MVAALVAWRAAEASLIRRLWRGDAKSANPFGEFGPIMYFLMLAIVALLVGGIGLLAAGVAHLVLPEDASCIGGGVVVVVIVALIGRGTVTLRQPTKPPAKT